MPITTLDPVAQTALMKEPAFTVQERERFTAWLADFKIAVTHIFFAISPDDLWDNAKATVQINLVGNNSRTTLAQGMYCIDLPLGVDDKYRDPVALAVAHFGECPPDVPRVPDLMAIILNKPTAHERFSAKDFLHKLAEANKDKPDIVEWASELV